LVTIKPAFDTNDAEQPFKFTIDPSRLDLGSDNKAGSMARPNAFSSSAFNGTCDGSHMPPWLSKVGFGAMGVALTTAPGLAFALLGSAAG